jgi:hypothetical protein
MIQPFEPRCEHRHFARQIMQAAQQTFLIACHEAAGGFDHEFQMFDLRFQERDLDTGTVLAETIGSAYLIPGRVGGCRGHRLYIDWAARAVEILNLHDQFLEA